ncbi:hypothetical protein ACFPM3_13885 [Streptomyces coeruleoprunus]|uniref:Integral membrane protein n=1 Tax=Streptomyces coeruleoprunus TaxID=285563 RepID=A0ABV9XFZ4_9ACTN
MTTRPVSRAQRLSWAAATLAGAAAGYGAIVLTANARAFCDAGWEAGGKFELNFLLVPMTFGLAVVALVAAVTARRLTVRAPRAVRAVAQLLAVLAVAGGLAWWFFAVRGTLDGYPGDSGLCPASNIPPWWPAWLPA